MPRPILIAIGQYYDWDLEPMRAEYDLHIAADTGAVADLAEAVRTSCEAVAFKGHAAFGGEVMDLLPALKLIANYGVGYDTIDVEAASARGVKVTNTPDVLNDDVADLAVALLLAQSRELRAAENWVRSGDWARYGDMRLARKVSGGRAGILGLGRIGREIADRLAAFKMEIHYHSRTPKNVPAGWTCHADPVSLAAAVDYLFVALVGGEATRGLVSGRVIEALGPDGVIVNISRGSTIDEGALLEALEQGRIRGAGLDVFLNEPNIDPRFMALENVVLLPHVGSGTIETRKAMGQLQRDNIAAHFAGRPLLTPVN